MIQASSGQQPPPHHHQQSMPSLHQNIQQQHTPTPDQEKQGLELIKSWFNKNPNKPEANHQQQRQGESTLNQSGANSTMPKSTHHTFPAQYYPGLSSGGPSLPQLSSLPPQSQGGQMIAYPTGMAGALPPPQFMPPHGLRSIPSVPSNHARSLGSSQSAAVMPTVGPPAFSKTVGPTSTHTVIAPTQFGGQQHFNTSWNPQMASMAQNQQQQHYYYQTPQTSTYYQQTRTAPYHQMALQPTGSTTTTTHTLAPIATTPQTATTPPTATTSNSHQVVTTHTMMSTTKNNTEAAETGLTFLIQKLADIDSNSEASFQRMMNERRSFAGDFNKTKAMLMQQISSIQGGGSAATTAPRPTPAQSGAYHPKGTYFPFFWEMGDEYEDEFAIEGSEKQIVRKVGDFEDEGWVIPVAGSLRMAKGGVYRWSLKIASKSQERPQLQFGMHGENHSKPWRLITTSRCSLSSDDEPWVDRAKGDRVIKEGDIIHVEVDLRGILPPPPTPTPGGEETNTDEASKTSEKKVGVLRYALNDEDWEVAFADIDIDSLTVPLVPIVSMGGHGCSVELLAA